MRNGFFHHTSGSVMLETVVTLPVVLLALMTAGQFAHIWYARQMVAYAAWCGARAAVVQVSDDAALESATSAAADVCSVITLMAETGSTGTARELPWLGSIPGSQDVLEKMTVTYTPATDSMAYCTVKVDMKFPLVFPLVNSIMSGVLSYVYEDDDGDFGTFEIAEGTVSAPFSAPATEVFPLISLSETAVMAKPVVLVE